MTDETLEQGLDLPEGADSVELVVEGEELLVRGFVRGLCVGGKNTAWPVFNQELGIKGEGLGGSLKEWVGLSEHLSHFIVSADSVGAIIAGLRDPRSTELNLRAARPILSARFDFKLAVYSEALGTQVREIFEQLPPGVITEGWSPKETRREDAKGDELYSPVHDYDLKAAGAVIGAFRGVLYVHERARRVEQVQEGQLELELGDCILSDA